VLYNFVAAPKGANPSGALIRDSAGNCYGTTEGGGAYVPSGRLLLDSRTPADSSDVTLSRHKSVLRGAALLVWAAGTAAMLGQQYVFRYYGTDDGLTNLAVKVLFQDRAGFLWAATENGLFRYDGQRFRHYGPTEGLPREVILSLGEAPDGSVLVGSRAGLYQEKGERFAKLVPPGSGVVDGYSGIQYDGKRLTYIATDRGLLVAHQSTDDPNLTFQLHPTPAAAGGTAAHGVLLDTEVWYGCGVSLCRIGKEGTTVFGETSGLAQGKWECIRRDGNGDLWVSDRRRFEVMRRGSQRFDTSIPAFPAAAGSGQLAVDAGGRLLVPTVEGLVISEGKRFRTVGPREGLRKPVYSVLQDREGAIWVGLAGKGLARWQGYGEWDGFSPATGLDSELIYEILPLGDGSLWVGTENGLFRGRKIGDRWIWRRHARVGKIPVHALRLDRDGNLWLGTEGSGIGRIDSRTDAIVWFKNARGLAAESPYSLALDSSQRLWAATESGLFVAQLPEPHFRRVEQVPPVRCWVVREGPGGQILAGGAAGLYRLSAGNWRHISTTDGLDHNVILAVAAIKPDEIWVGYWFSGRVTRIRVSGEHLSMTHFGRDQGLRGEMSYFLGFDADGRLWSGSDQGVRVWNGDRWTQYDQSDGLIWNDCDLGAFAAEPGGTVWIGTSGGLGRFQASRMERAVRPTSTVFTKLTLGNHMVEAGRFVSTDRRLNSLAAQYSALAFAHESSIVFRYRLKPLFGDWRETPLHELQFPGLPPNEYSLEVEAREFGGQWSKWPAVFAFEIRPPWWRAWWFCALAATAALTLIRWVWRWRVLQLLRRQKELEHAVAERTRELQQEKLDLLVAREALRERALKDGLTGLFNRRAFFDILESELARTDRQSGSLALIMADLDLFKKINDTYGHVAGDVVLQECARRILAWVRPYDTVGRYGGEELVILMPECRLEEATERAERVRRAIAEQPIATSAGAISVTCSFGVSATTSLATKAAELVESADQALYCAKEHGRNCVMPFPSEAALTRVEEIPETYSR
jgi:diguanylate cyclase (GGDEF)-like protein